MKNNIVIVLTTVALVTEGASFFGGMKYQESKRPSRAGFRSQMKARTNHGIGGSGQFASAKAIRGEIISKDNEGLTIKLPDGSSKIVFLSEKTKINKATEGSVDDLQKGKQIMVFGQENSDKSIFATNIQLDFGFKKGMWGN